MRIISGTARGLKLQSLSGSDTRPTLDNVKEAIFSMLFDYVRGARVLDLFAGSGALGIEALSRGAEHADFVDLNPAACKVIKENLTRSRFLDVSKLYTLEAKAYIERAKKDGKKYDLIFLDPPYNKGFIAPIIEAVISKNLLSDEGIIVLESDHLDEHGEFSGLDVLKQKRYGRTYITVYQRGDSI